MTKWNIFILDVWGNEEDGFDINESYDSGKYLKLDVDFKNEDILNGLLRIGMLKDSVTLKDIEIEDIDEYMIGINDAVNSRPIYELRLMD